MGREFGAVMNLEDYLDNNQQQEICSIIQSQCRRFQDMEKQYQSLFYEPYMTMRHKHTATSAVISGFTPDTKISGITVNTVQYGLHNRMSQPELVSDKAIFQIYSDGSALNAQILKNRCKQYNHDLTTPPTFLLIIFTTSGKGNLEKIDVALPNENSIIIKTFPLYTRPQIKVVSA